MPHLSSSTPARLRSSIHLLKRVAITALVSVTISGSSLAAGLVFSDDFEAGNTSKWTQDGGRNKCTVVTRGIDGTGPAGGSYMAECNWNGVVEWNAANAYSTLKLNSFNYSKEFLIRFKIRYDADVDHKFGAKAFRIYGSDSYYFGAQMETTNGPMFSYFETINGSPGPMTYGDGSAFGWDGKWHEVEIYVKHNDSGSSNGVVRVWQDGRVIHQASNIVSATSGAKWSPIYIMSNWSNNGPDWEHDAANHTYWDNFEIYSDSGTGSTGAMSDGTIGGGGSTPTTKTPNPPTDVR